MAGFTRVGASDPVFFFGVAQIRSVAAARQQEHQAAVRLVVGAVLQPNVFNFPQIITKLEI